MVLIIQYCIDLVVCAISVFCIGPLLWANTADTGPVTRTIQLLLRQLY